jgi:hypothetical protein
MEIRSDIKQIESDIRLMKETAVRLQLAGEDFPALSKNIKRILASIKMLEINVSDVLTLSQPG